MTQPQLSMRGDSKPWTSSEILKLRNNANLGAEACAALLGRSVKSVKHKAARERISLRKPGERRGLLIGQSRTTAWMEQEGISPVRLAQMREEAIAGTLDIGDLERRILDAVRRPNRPLCPWCGTRPQQKSTTGLCEPCHLRELARQHREEAERAAARRELDAARQQASRARRKVDNVVQLFPPADTIEDD